MDEKPSPYPASTPSVAASADAPPSYEAAEGSQPVRVVYVQPTTVPQSSSPAKDYLALSIFTILCCFWPLGLIALLKSVEVRRHNRDGLYDKAGKASKDARLFSILGIVIGIIGSIVGGFIAALNAAGAAGRILYT